MKKINFETHEVLQFSSIHRGPHLLVFGAVHGDEVCGTTAIRNIVARVQNGQIGIDKGTITFVPICNPKAYYNGTRFVEKNLNRVITHRDSPSFYEEQLAVNIMRLIDACDWLLDIHSFHSQGPAFVFHDSSNANSKAFAHCLGPRHFVTGWSEMYASPEANIVNAGDTVIYAHKRGKAGCVIECGYHPDPQAVFVAEKAIQNAIEFLGISKAGDQKVKPVNPIVVRGYKVVAKRKNGRFVKEWQHLDPVCVGDTIGIYDDGTKEKADSDGFIMLPKTNAYIGEEWFYLGVLDNKKGSGSA